MKKRIYSYLLIIIIMALMLCSCSNLASETNSSGTRSADTNTSGISSDIESLEQATNITAEQTKENQIIEGGEYSKPEEIAEYIHTYNKLPQNYITKKEAMGFGWESNKGNLWDVADKMSIGGDSFGNREGRLPKANGRKWYECDVNYNGGYRGSERILYSNDGLIYYSENHYETFTQLY